MARYSKPVWQMLKDAVEELGELTGSSAVQYIHDHFPDDWVNKGTIQLQLIACSVNHTSADKFDDPNRFLWYIGNGRYRAYNPETDHAELKEGWRITQVNLPTPREEPVDEVPFSRLEVGNRIVLPSPVVRRLGLSPNDVVAFVDNEGKFYVRKGRLKIEVD
jgi:hypothetical protein